MKGLYQRGQQWASKGRTQMQYKCYYKKSNYTGIQSTWNRNSWQRRNNWFIRCLNITCEWAEM